MGVEEGGPAGESLADLQAENARLVELLEAHGIDWRRRRESTIAARESAASRLSTQEKVSLFRRLFRGRQDVYPIRWESRTTDRSGYAPACANEWRAGLCEKPRVKCADCANRSLIPLTDRVIYDHLLGVHTVGVYPLLEDDTCWFLAVDFDEAEWREDARAFRQSCDALGVPVSLEISRSGRGAHAWVFFAGPVPARHARGLGTAIISHACASTRQLRLESYDRLFPSQDTMPKGGYGNLIALPLQKAARESGGSVFVDDAFTPYADQWSYLSSVVPMSPHDVEPVMLRATAGVHPLDVTFIDDEDVATPWIRRADRAGRLTGQMPESLTATLANLIYLEKSELPQSLMNRLVRLAAFQNPEFYRAQALRMSVWDKPRIIGCAENYPRHVALPRGCLEAVGDLLRTNGIRLELRDQRQTGDPIQVDFLGQLRADQEAAIADIVRHDTGVLCAPTGFGKTVTAAAIIARRGVNALVLVHRTELLRQWRERLEAFLGVGKDVVGVIGGGRRIPTGRIDIAVTQSLSRHLEVDSLVENYGHVIVDECHHVGAASVEAILKRVRARFVLGLTATPIRRDGQQPIIFMQCGPIRHRAGRPSGAPHALEVLPRIWSNAIELPAESAIQNVFRSIADDRARTQAIATAASEAYQRGRKVLVLTERKDHVDMLHAVLEDLVPAIFVLHGRMSKRRRLDVLAELETLPVDAPRLVLATGKLIGEGFDHPPLDTLVLAMPISWKGTLQQYVGRLNREQAAKIDVQIIDFVDDGHPALRRMWEKRQRGYRAMGYVISPDQSLRVGA